MGSSNITRGFSASRISYSQLLHPLPADETTPARNTTQPGLPIAENRIRISALGGLPSDDHEVIQTDREEISKGPTNDNDSSIDWEDSVSESDVSRVDEKEPFPMTKLPPEKPSQPSLLTAMMCQSSSTTIQPGKAIGAGRITSSPAMHLLNPATNGPFLKISQDENDDESTLIMGEHPIYISNSGDTSAPSSPVVLSPTTIRENMLAHELDKSPIYHSNQEQKQRSTTVNSGFNRRLKAPNTANVEECSSWEYRTENQQTRQCSNSISTQPIFTEQSHENKPWNYYFDNGPWEYHSKGW